MLRARSFHTPERVVVDRRRRRAVFTITMAALGEGTPSGRIVGGAFPIFLGSMRSLSGLGAGQQVCMQRLRPFRWFRTKHSGTRLSAGVGVRPLWVIVIATQVMAGSRARGGVR